MTRRTVRQELEVGARMGDPECIARLTGPEPPDSVVYLLHLADDVRRDFRAADGVGWEMLKAWAELKDVSLLPHEVDGVLTLCTLMRFPDAGEETD